MPQSRRNLSEKLATLGTYVGVYSICLYGLLYTSYHPLRHNTKIINMYILVFGYSRDKGRGRQGAGRLLLQVNIMPFVN